ncbi:polymorphic toxin-type HINT domain-containing protein [Streptomyces argenteolus]|uniref:polymorphic toxin-type HINT domain-containing protein n=1 Tax=Streptomyces sp. NPDC025273 TaxID=3155251 RepID=UPI0033F9A6B0
MSRIGTRGWTGALALAVVVGLLPATAVAAAAEAKGANLPKLKQPPAVSVKEMTAGGTKSRGDRAPKWKTPKVTWPAPGSATVDLKAGASGTAPERAGSLPVALRPAPSKTPKAAPYSAKVKVNVLDRNAARKAGVEGILLTVGAADAGPEAGKAQVQVDYKSFRGAYGGDWAARLRLVQLPACVLTTPDKPVCRISTPLTTTNNTEAGTLTATVPVSGTATPSPGVKRAAAVTVLAAAAEDSGPTGNYKATSLQSSGSWSAGGSTGAFNWSYPIGVPAVPTGLQPSISLDYTSQSVDGRTAAANNQPSWLGDGWNWEPGYVERRYKPCNDDKDGGTNTTKVGDLCWFNNNATMSLGGKSTELVYDSVKGWHPATDSGEKVEKLTGASNPDKGTAGVDGAGEHWKITTADGTQYFFGLNQLPGWSNKGTTDKADDDPVTNSVLTTPVFGNQSDEPCYNASFASAWCQQAWRWQLDYVVDPHGNAMAYYWNAEANNYGLNVSETTGKATVTPYDRGGYLDHIDYGLRSNSVYTAKAMGQVKFDVAERCLTSCGTFDEANAKNWPDVPFDQYCKDAATECKSQYSPTFWSRKRLTGITTKVLTGGAYKDVDTWALKQAFPPSGDGVSTPMWLDSITRTGKAGGSVQLPAVTFSGVQKPNRVDKLGDGLAPFIRLRMSQITTESGGTIGIDYLDPECTTSSLPPTDASNTTRCYPVKWAYEGETAKLDWFNSYAVQRVTEGDNLAESPDTVTEYTYLGGADWAKSTDEFTKADDRTYSIARGFYRVQVRKGTALDPKTLSESRYFRGIDGADVKDSTGATVTDREQFAGMLRETATYNGDGGALVSATSYTPWRSSKTAVRTRSGLPDLEAYLTGTEAEETRTTVTGGSRTTKVTRHFDEYGKVDWTSSLGDVSKDGDEQCLTTTYARNTAKWILETISRAETVSVACGEPVTRPDDVIDDVRTHYDGGIFGAAPTRGLITKVEQINGSGVGYSTTGSTPSTCGVAQNELCYDIYGRALASADANNKITKTTYSPATGEAPTKVVATNPLGHTETTVLDPLRGQPLTVTDANDKVTSSAYDALGRLTKVWIPTRSAQTYPNAPSSAFTYLVRNDGPVVVTTKTLDHNSEYRTGYTFYDGMLRSRQTQETSPDKAGRLVSETFYNTRGEAVRSSGRYFATGAAEPVLVTGQETKYPSSTETVFDGAGRPTTVIAKRFGDETKRTTTTYTGDSTTVIPPAGGTATTALVDALGRTTELKQYTDAARTTSQSISYDYNPQGRLKQVTDPSGAKWTYAYDTRGRATTTTDPDKGQTTTVFDASDRPTDVTDARDITLHTDYDALGRKTALKKGSTTLASWAYDTVAKGLPSSATRYSGGNAYVNEITEYNSLEQPVGIAVTIPDSEGALAGTYEWFNFYDDNTGLLMETEHPEIGGLPAESVSNAYNTSGLLDSVYAGDDPLISSSTYDHYGQNTRQQYGEFGRQLFVTNEFDDHTGNLTHSYTDREAAPQRIEDTGYTYDPANNLLAIATAYGQDTTRTTDTQCFTLDALRRITEAWTNTGTQCAQTPAPSVVGGQDAYWTSYTYDAVGNRKTETQHKTASGPAADTLRTYTAPATGTHQLPAVAQTGTDAHTETYTYDEAGNTKGRKFGNDATQTLEWDDEGHLKALTKVTDTTSYLYDADGQRLTRKDSTGTTLYLPAGNELHLDKSGKATGTRYYSPAGDNLALRTGNKLTFTLTDHHNTTTTQITNDAAQTVTRRKTTIFGAPRGTQPTNWIGDKAFVGGTTDQDTDLTHLGAREYDPRTGLFISVDPLMDLTDSQQIHGYTYANNNPVTLTDPTGTRPDGACGGSSSQCNGHTETFTKTEGGGWDYDNPAYDDSLTDNDIMSLTNAENSALYDISNKVFAHFGGKSDVTRWMEAFWSEYRPTSPWADTRAREAYATAMGVCHDLGCSDDLRNYFWDTHLTGVVETYGISDGGGMGGLPGMARTMRSGKASSAQASGCRCFLAGTEVLMADGTTKEIEDVRAGDEVLTTDPETGKSAKRRVTKLIVTEDDKQFNELTISTPDGETKLTATHEHPFWSPSQNRWIAASKLTTGTTLLTDDLITVTVKANRPFSQHARTYNLTIDDFHTYYVLAGQTPVLVHNSNCDVSDLASKIDVENISMTKTVENHTWDIAGTRDVDAPNFGKAARPYMNGNNGMLLREIMGGSAPRMDSRGAPGVVEWRTPGAMNGSNGIWELNIDANSNRIVHFLFKSTKG